MRPLTATAVLLLTAGNATVRAQTQASIGVGFGTVRFAGGSSFSSALLSPAVQLAARNVSLGATGVLSSLPEGDWSTYTRADFWLATGAAGSLRFAVGTNLTGSTRTEAPGTFAAHATGEVLWTRSPGGVAIGVGPSLGAIAGERPVTALRFRDRAWGVAGPVQYGITVEPQRFLDAWFTDATASATFEPRRSAVVSLWLTTRLSREYGSRAVASGSLLLSLAPILDLEAGGGGYLADPYQGFPRAGFVSVGLRFHAPRRPSGVVGTSEAPRPAPLMPARRGDSLVVRFRMAGATSVAIAGDWTGWAPRPLAAVGNDVWEGVLALRSGTYHFSLLVDSREWVVPGGVALVPDGMGGMVAVLLVP